MFAEIARYGISRSHGGLLADESWQGWRHVIAKLRVQSGYTDLADELTQQGFVHSDLQPLM